MTVEAVEIKQDKQDIPKKWEWAKLKEICETTSGGTPLRKHSEYFGGKIPWLKSGELNDGLITASEEYITEEGLNNSSAKLFPEGTLLIALYGATVGKLGILNFESSTNQAICGIFPPEEIDKKYLFWHLKNKRKNLLNSRIGGAQPNISQTILNELPVPIAPLSEQKRIVCKIEELFTELDKGVEYLKDLKTQLRKYRQSVLKHAFSGEMYKTTEWQTVNITKVCKKLIAGRDKPKTFSPIKTYECGVPIYSNGITNDGLYGYTDKATVDEPSVTISARGTIGYVSIRKEPCCPIIRLITAIPDTKIITIEFLAYSLRYLIPYSTGSSIPQLTVPDFKNNSILLPSLQEQQEIVEEIEKHLSVADKVEQVVEQSLKQADRLRQSILKQAFEGKLVPQDPTDEPASVLLERIRKMRAKASGKRGK